MRVAAATEVGKRKQNEDSYLVLPTKTGLACAVSDGMGGHAAGATASRISVETLAEWIGFPDADVESVLRRAVAQANETVYKLSLSDDSMFGMGATLVAAIATKKRFVVANVGDSRLYRFDGQTLTQITHDHSFVQELVRRGIISREEARTHPRRNVITRAIGTEQGVEPDLFEAEWNKGDCLLLCSDGLCGVLDDALMASVLQNEASLEQACQTLIEMALSHGSTDNITVVLVQNEEDAQ